MKKITILLVLMASIFTTCKNNDNNSNNSANQEIISFFLAHEWQLSHDVLIINFNQQGNSYYIGLAVENNKVTFSQDSKGNYVATWKEYDDNGKYLYSRIFTVNPNTGDGILTFSDGGEVDTYYMIK